MNGLWFCCGSNNSVLHTVQVIQNFDTVYLLQMHLIQKHCAYRAKGYKDV